MATTSEVKICSNALLLLGAGTIASLSEGNDRARLVSNLYEQTRNATLRAHPWKFAKRRIKLGPLAADPNDFGWGYKFQLPGDHLRTCQVGEEPTDRPNYLEEGRAIFFDDDELPLVYVRELTDVSIFDALFVDTLCARMAHTCAYPLTKDKDLQIAMYELYMAKLREARAVDGISNPPQALDDSGILRARRLGSSIPGGSG